MSNDEYPELRSSLQTYVRALEENEKRTIFLRAKSVEEADRKFVDTVSLGQHRLLLSPRH